MRALLLLALAGLSGCVIGRPKPGPWIATGGTPAEQAQAVQIAEAGKRVFPDGALRNGGTINLLPDIDVPCGYKFPEPPNTWHYSGCIAKGAVWVLWPHPKLPGADLTSSALPHELGHIAFPLCTEAQAEEAAEVIVEEYRWSQGGR